ncbi:MAG: DNA repair protein RadA, partial [Nocardioides sp.]|nr:DNA repair protein RadA [Nocardioides sp.]
AGELRRVRDLPQRLAEAARLGFRVAVVPRDRSSEGGAAAPTRARMIDGLEVVEADHIAGALLTLGLNRAD